MKRYLLILVLLFIIPGCITTGPPAGCEKSILYGWSPYSFIVMDASRVAAVKLMPKFEYDLAQKSAYALADVLSSDPLATIDTITQMPDWSRVLVTDLSVWFKPGDLLNPCDRDLIVGYLRKW